MHFLFDHFSNPRNHSIEGRLGGRYRPALNHPAVGEVTLNRDNSSRVTTVDRVARIETVETSSLYRKDRGGWRIWLTPLWSILGELVEISHRPDTYVEHDGRCIQIYILAHVQAFIRITCTQG